MELFDSHVHYEDAQFKEDRHERLEHLKNTDVKYVLNCCSDVEVFDTIMEIVEKHDFVYGSIGIHPHWTEETPSDYLNRIRELVKHPKIVAIGEMGLDYFWNEPKDLQKRIFKEQLQLAKELNCEKTAVLGYRNELLLLEDFEAVCDTIIATEDGSAGTKGNVIDAIKANGATADVIYACGPTPMLRALKAYAEENDMECYISMEERMACGIGACLACVCKTKEKDHHTNVNNKRICKEGPVFNAKEVEL